MKIDISTEEIKNAVAEGVAKKMMEHDFGGWFKETGMKNE